MQTKPNALLQPVRLYMKHLKFLTAAILFLSGIGIKVQAQTAPDKPVYIVFNYAKINPGKDAMYKEMLKTYSQKIVEYRFKEGSYLGWYVNEVRMPSGTAKEYDYVTVIVTSSFKDIFEDKTPTKEIYSKVFPGITDKMFDDIGTQFNECRKLVKREVFTFTAGLNNGSKPSKYAQIDFMKSTDGKSADYVKMEKEVYMPVHKERVAMGALEDWGLYEKQMPYDSHTEYDYITGNFFTDINSLTNSKYTEAFKKVWPKQDMTKLNVTTEANRKLVRSEIWELIQYVDDNNTKK